MSRLLVVDDSLDVLKHVGDTLRRAGHAVACTNDARDAICLLEQQRYDLLILDVVMPGMDGVELLRRLGPLAPPTLVMTGSGAKLEDFYNSAVKRVLPKPFDGEDVVRMAHAILDAKPADAFAPDPPTGLEPKIERGRS